MRETGVRTGGRMKGTTVRRVGLVLAVAAALTGVAACTSSDSSDRPGRTTVPQRGASLAALRSAERATERAESARVESTTTMGTLMSMAADGALGWDDGLTGTLTITYTGGTIADTMRRLGTTSMEARYLPDAYYARMGDEVRRAGRRQALDQVRLRRPEALAGGSGADLGDQMRNTTPNQSVKLLLASGDVQKGRRGEGARPAAPRTTRAPWPRRDVDRRRSEEAAHRGRRHHRDRRHLDRRRGTCWSRRSRRHGRPRA